VKTAPAPAKNLEHRALDGALARGIGVVGAYAAIAGAVRLGQDAAIAWRFGTGPLVDAYYFLLSVAGWPIAVALSLLSLLIAPVDAGLRSADPLGLRRFRGELLAAMLVIAALSLPLAWWGLRVVAGSALARLDASAVSIAESGAIGLAPMVPLGLVGALLSAWLIAGGRHILTLLEGIPAAVVLLLVLFLPHRQLFWATSLGFAVQLMFMATVLGRAGELPRPTFGRSGQHWNRFSDGAVVLFASQLLFTLVPLVDSFFAARLGQGAVAAVSYTNRLILGLQGLAALALQRTGLPLLSGLSIRSLEATRAAALRWAVGMGAVGAVGGVIVAILSDPMISLFFEHGRFTAADREQCAQLLRYGMLQMPFFIASMALVTALASVSARRALATVALANIAVKLLASALLVPWLGPTGLMVSTAAMYAVAAATAWIALRHHLPRRRA
jgi:putative peptidoglycan lipid II flippase